MPYETHAAARIYNKRMLITQVTSNFAGARAQAYCMTEISYKQLRRFPGCSMRKKIKISFSRWWHLELATSPIAKSQVVPPVTRRLSFEVIPYQ